MYIYNRKNISTLFINEIDLLFKILFFVIQVF